MTSCIGIRFMPADATIGEVPMLERIRPARSIQGVVEIPGDKSISHRYALLTGVAQGESKIYNYSTGADCQSTVRCMRQLGARYEFREEEQRRVLVVEGVGLRGLHAANTTLDAGNSGSTMRMLAGILAGQTFKTDISGDDSLVKRPMKRIIVPLEQMGARVAAMDGQYPPLAITGAALRAIHYRLPVPSAQVKSCVLLAGLYADGETVVEESVTTRDHTEIALEELGADIDTAPRRAAVRGGTELKAKVLVVPGDLSSAAFFLVAAAVAQEANLTVTNVGLNPTRAGLLDVLRGMGVNLRVLHLEQLNGEMIGSLQVSTSRVQGGLIEGAATASLIDEIPVLAVLGALSSEGLTFKDAGELRVKETDRIESIAANLNRMGVNVETTSDSLHIPGRQQLQGATLDSFGDHRIAMAFAVAALSAKGESTIRGAEAASVSFPEFFGSLSAIAA